MNVVRLNKDLSINWCTSVPQSYAMNTQQGKLLHGKVTCNSMEKKHISYISIKFNSFEKKNPYITGIAKQSEITTEQKGNN